jgi:predicted secreted protein
VLAVAALMPTTPALARTVTVTAKSNGKTLSIHTGDKVVVKLAANSSTGYRWSTSRRPDKRVVKLVASNYVPTPTSEPIAGSGGTQVIKLTATGAGTTSLKLAYLSPGTPHTVGQRFRLTFKVR